MGCVEVVGNRQYLTLSRLLSLLCRSSRGLIGSVLLLALRSGSGVPLTLSLGGRGVCVL